MIDFGGDAPGAYLPVMQQSIREIQEYTNNYNQQYNVNVGKSQRQQSQPTQVSQPAASSNFSSLWGD